MCFSLYHGLEKSMVASDTDQKYFFKTMNFISMKNPSFKFSFSMARSRKQIDILPQAGSFYSKKLQKYMPS
jgi:hypothetical protein